MHIYICTHTRGYICICGIYMCVCIYLNLKEIKFYIYTYLYSTSYLWKYEVCAIHKSWELVWWVIYKNLEKLWAKVYKVLWKRSMIVQIKNSLGAYFLDILPWDLYLKRKSLGLGTERRPSQEWLHVGEACLAWKQRYEVEMHRERVLFVCDGQGWGWGRTWERCLAWEGRKVTGRGGWQREIGSWNGDDGATLTAATGAEVSSESRHAITHEGGYSLVLPHTVVKWPSDIWPRARRGGVTQEHGWYSQKHRLWRMTHHGLGDSGGRKLLKWQQKHQRNVALGDLVTSQMLPAFVFRIVDIIAHISTQGYDPQSL